MGNRQIERIKAVQNRYNEALSDVGGGMAQVSILKEALDVAVRDLLRFEDEGWLSINKLNWQNSKGLSLSDIQEVAAYLEEQVKVMGGILGRGLRLKNNHVFGRGFQFEHRTGGKIAPRFQKVLEDPENREVLFSPAAFRELNRILFSSGNLFVIYNKRTKKFSRLAIDLNIENYLSYDDQPDRLKYILRKYDVRNDLSPTPTTKVVQEWVPVSTYALSNPENIQGSISVDGKPIKVNKDLVAIDLRINKDNGEVWGVPDAFSAAPWAVIYSNYLRDHAKLANALAAISFVVKAKTQAAAKAAGAKIQSARVGQAAITGPETEINSMPKANSIDMYTGRPLLAMVAANLDVSTTGIASDPGPGGSYASESALSQPEQMAALSRQEEISGFFAKVFEVLGEPEIVIGWHRLDADPLHRVMASAVLARVNGGIHQEEFRNTALEVLDITPTSTKMPEPDEWTGSKQQSLVDASLMDDPDPDNSGNGGVPGQGQSGSVGALDDDGNDARNSDRDASEA